MADTEFVYKDLGLDRIRRDLAKLDHGRVVVGWPGNGPTHDKGGMSVASLAIVHEFGSPKNGIPSRPVMRQTNARFGKGPLPRLGERLYKQILQGTTAPGTALKQLGVYWEGCIKRMFREGVFAPLKPATIRRKGSSKPLIDSGQLRASVTSKVEGL